MHGIIVPSKSTLCQSRKKEVEWRVSEKKILSSIQSGSITMSRNFNTFDNLKFLLSLIFVRMKNIQSIDVLNFHGDV